MSKLIIVLGMPGSGKTTYIDKLVKSGEIKSQCKHDDYYKDSLENMQGVFRSRHYISLIENLKNGETCAISDIEFCNESELHLLLDVIKADLPNVEIIEEYRVFENNPDACKQNVIERGKKEHDRNIEEELQKIDRLTFAYQIPNGAKIIPVVNMVK